MTYIDLHRRCSIFLLLIFLAFIASILCITKSAMTSSNLSSLNDIIAFLPRERETSGSQKKLCQLKLPPPTSLNESCFNRVSAPEARWFYDLAAKRCKQFMWNGCGRDVHFFITEQVCKNVCTNSAPQHATYIDRYLNYEPCHKILQSNRHCPKEFAERLKLFYTYSPHEGSCHQVEHCVSPFNSNLFDQYQVCLSRCQTRFQNRPKMCTSYDARCITRYPYSASGKRHTTIFYYKENFGSCVNAFFNPICSSKKLRKFFLHPHECSLKCEHAVSDKVVQDRCFGATRTIIEDQAINSKCNASNETGIVQQRWFYHHVARRCLRQPVCLTSMYAANDFAERQICTQTCLPKSRKDLCSLAVDVGPCGEPFTIAYFYNHHTHKCEPFFYSGCHGNRNRFLTKALCYQMCGGVITNHISLKKKRTTYLYKSRWFSDQPQVAVGYEICHIPPSSGSCRVKDHKGLRRFYYNKLRGKCIAFPFSGCGGNSNNFETVEDCLNTCKNRLEGKPTSTDARCVIEIETPNTLTKLNCHENCLTNITLSRNCTTVWIYNEKALRCFKTRQPRSCIRHVNYFAREIECSKACLTTVATIDIIQDRCLLPVQVDTFYMNGIVPAIKGFYFDAESRTCLVSNNFEVNTFKSNFFPSLSDCKATCSPVSRHLLCLIQIDAGPCTDRQSRWAYDKNLQECVSFVYSGCHGNRNRFLSKEECLDVCKPLLFDNRCNQKPSAGKACVIRRNKKWTISRTVIRYYFNSDYNTCFRFRYKGCAGNANNYVSEHECKRHCLHHLMSNRNFSSIPRMSVKEQKRCLNSEENNSTCLISCVYDKDCLKSQKCCSGHCKGGHNCVKIMSTEKTLTNDDKKQNCSSNHNTSCFSLAPYAVENITTLYTVGVGQHLQLDCSLTGVPQAVITWHRKDQAIKNGTGRILIIPYLNYSRLVIESVELMDFGEWHCIAHNSIGKKAIYFNLNIVMPPKIARIDGPSDVLIGNESVTFNCIVNGIPKPQVVWLHRKDKNNTQEIVVSRSTQLKVVPGPYTSGLYICEANNGYGPTAQRQTRLLWRVPMQIKPLTSFFKNHQWRQPLSTNASLELNCTLLSGFPPPFEILWQHDGNKLVHNSLKSRLKIAGNTMTINQLSFKDTGKYRCTMRNEYELVSSLEFNLKLNTSPATIKDCVEILWRRRRCPPCTYGYQRDADGCQTCSCVEPCNSKACPQQTDTCHIVCLSSNCVNFETQCRPASPLLSPSPRSLASERTTAAAMCVDSLKSSVCQIIVLRYNCRQYAKKCCASCIRAGKVSMKEMLELAM